MVDPKIIDEIIELECEVLELQDLKGDLEEEIKEKQKIIDNEEEGKIALLQALKRQEEKVDHFQHRQEQMDVEHAQLLSAQDEQIQNLQNTIEQMKAQLPGKSPPIPPEECQDVEVENKSASS